MLLNVKQRLLLLNIIPDEGSYDTLKIVRDQQNLLSFNEEELKRLKIVREGEMYQWDETADEPVDISIGEMSFNVIKMALRRLNEEGKLQMEFLPLYEHFVEGEDWPPQEATDTKKVASDNEHPTEEPVPIRTTKDVVGSSPSAEGADPKS